jgi:hypothetical protein
MLSTPDRDDARLSRRAEQGRAREKWEEDAAEEVEEEDEGNEGGMEEAERRAERGMGRDFRSVDRDDGVAGREGEGLFSGKRGVS